MVKHKKIEPLVSEELIRKVKELGNLSKQEKAKACGYYSITKNGLERVNMKQFLNALIDAEGIELDGNGKANKQETSNTIPITEQSSRSTDSNKVITVIRVNQPTAKPLILSQPVQQPEVQPVQQLEIQQPEVQQIEIQPEQPEPLDLLESLVEPPRNESVYGSGWSLAELMNEFGGR